MLIHEAEKDGRQGFVVAFINPFSRATDLDIADGHTRFIRMRFCWVLWGVLKTNP